MYTDHIEAQSLVALMRSFGPATGASVLAWSFRSGYPFPLNQYLTFLLCIMMCAMAVALSFQLPIEVNLPKNELHKSDSNKNLLKIELEM